MGYFYWLRAKSQNHLQTELNLVYLKGTKFCLQSKALFIDISSIAEFKPFLIAWLREYCTFSDSSVVNLESSPWPKYTQLRTTFQKKSCSTIKLFFLFKFKYVLQQTVLSKYLKKKTWGHCARLREKKNLFRYRAQFEGNLLRFARARAHVRAPMTRKSCAVGMRNAILRNYLNSVYLYFRLHLCLFVLVSLTLTFNVNLNLMSNTGSACAITRARGS